MHWNRHYKIISPKDNWHAKKMILSVRLLPQNPDSHHQKHPLHRIFVVPHPIGHLGVIKKHFQCLYGNTNLNHKIPSDVVSSFALDIGRPTITFVESITQHMMTIYEIKSRISIIDWNLSTKTNLEDEHFFLSF